MRLHRKNKGFTLIELMVVIAVMIILLGVIIGSTGEQRQKAIVEEKASAIRDFLVEVGAIASKTGVDVVVVKDGNGANQKLIAKYIKYKNDGSIDSENLGAEIRNFEGGKRRFIPLADNIDSFQFAESDPPGQSDGKYLTYNTSKKSYTNSLSFSNNISGIYISRTGPSFTELASKNARKIPYYKIKKGMYTAIIEVCGTGNINIYTCHNKARTGNTVDKEFYQTK